MRTSICFALPILTGSLLQAMIASYAGPILCFHVELYDNAVRLLPAALAHPAILACAVSGPFGVLITVALARILQQAASDIDR